MLEPPFYVTSDTHFYHGNIVNFCGRAQQIKWIAGKEIDHNEYMLDMWNQTVGENDNILHLGDLYFGRDGEKNFKRHILPYLSGDKYLILGNHDKGRDRYEEMGFTVLDPFTIKYGEYKVQFSHYPADPGELKPKGKTIRVHGHIHNNGYPVVAGPHGWKEGVTMDSPRQINVSVEMIDYIPQEITELLDKEIRGF